MSSTETTEAHGGRRDRRWTSRRGAGPAGGEGRRARARVRALQRRQKASMRSQWRKPLFVVGAAIALVWVVLALLAPAVLPGSPLAQDAPRLQPPSSENWFGTDELGRDVFTRVVHGARISLPLALVLVVSAAAIGGAIGAIAGYFGGWVDEIVMRLSDLVFAFPTIILAMAVTAALGPGLGNAVIALIVVSWPVYARVVRGLVLSARELDYVHATRLLGSSSRRALLVEVLPNVAGPVAVLAMLELGNAILLLSGLSFLGLGAQAPTPEWGAMVAGGARAFDRWWLGAFPGLAILTVVLAFNFIGDSLRDALDPRTARAIRGRDRA